MSIRKFDRNMGSRNPFSGFFRDSLFDNPMEENQFLPATNVKTLEDSYHIDLALPGYRKEHVHISVEDNVLTISAEEVKESEITEDYTRREFYQSSFSRSFSLPDDVNEDKIKAHFEDGILKIRIGRHDHDPKQRSRKIDIT